MVVVMLAENTRLTQKRKEQKQEEISGGISSKRHKGEES
jgi:hypothetical protein